jgi:hypothetical protein
LLHIPSKVLFMFVKYLFWIQWIPGSLSLRVKRLGREADHSPPSSAEVKERVELYLHSHYAFMGWCLVKAQGQLALYQPHPPLWIIFIPFSLVSLHLSSYFSRYLSLAFPTLLLYPNGPQQVQAALPLRPDWHPLTLSLSLSLPPSYTSASHTSTSSFADSGCTTPH